MCKEKQYSYENLFILVMIILFFIFISSFIINRGGTQESIFFNQTSDYMADYYNVAKYSSDRNVYYYGKEDPAAAEHAYLPFAYTIFYFLSRCADYINLDAFSAGRGTTMGLATSAFFMFMISTLLYVILYDSYNGKKVYKFGVATTLMLSSVFIFSFERGNIIILAVLFLAFFIMNYNHSNKVIREIAFIALAMSAALKGYPALFGILLIFEKRYKEAIRLIIYGIIFAFLPFLFFEGGFRCIPIWLENVSANSELYERLTFPRFNFRYWANMIRDSETKKLIYNIFSKLSTGLCVLAILTSYFHKKTYKRVLQLLLCIIILPVNSAQYSGLYLFIAIILFFNEQEKGKIDRVYLCLFLFILNPFQILIGDLNLTTMVMNIATSLMLILIVGEAIVQAIKQRRFVLQVNKS